jgi:hypothetical protein
MTDATAMSTPVTRGELQEEFMKLRQDLQQALVPLATKADLEPLATKAELVPIATKAELVPIATKAELVPLATKAELVPLATKAELSPLATKADLAPLATKVELEMWGGALLARIQADKRELAARIELSEQRLLAELARHATAFQEWTSSMITVIDEKYADLPSRVGRLEAEVFAPGRR